MKVLYTNHLWTVLNEAWISEVLGGKLPKKPVARQFTYQEALDMGLMVKTRTGEIIPYRQFCRYSLSDGCISYTEYEQADLVVNAIMQPDGTWIGTHDSIRLNDAMATGNPNPVIVPLEWRNGIWWAHLQVQHRFLMNDSWTVGVPGGYNPKGTSSSQGAVIEIKEEFGKVEMKHLELPDYALGWANRATYQIPNIFGWFVFDSATWEVSSDPGGFEVVAKPRLAIPLTSQVLFPDSVVGSSMSFARSCHAAGMLSKFEQ